MGARYAGAAGPQLPFGKKAFRARQVPGNPPVRSNARYPSPAA
ncbi:hypothetical protein Hsw_PA0038 (plasmid) [Hymenobacter swuensis DY53]|uniref:Uncharacterized protein n=1 Tax=Hymenobacter swuensis DY53 TaxID=1227739 RepID=W8EYE1_9BACT|nr:hypothetical protein Hsw_PA0038 [Hymenobacter swuensis DY53]